MSVSQISAITLKVTDMKKSVYFYSKIPGLSLRYGGKNRDIFSSFEIVNNNFKSYVNLELRKRGQRLSASNFGRVIFYTSDVDKLYSKLRMDIHLAAMIVFENEPLNAVWGERYFHIRDPDGYELSFAQPRKGIETLS